MTDTITVHFNNLMGMKGMCQSIEGAASTVDEMHKFMPKIYKHQLPGPCTPVAGVEPHCKSSYGMTTCTTSNFGASEETVELLHE